VAHLIEIGPPQPRRFELGEVTCIGRDPANEVCLSDALVSPKHAQLRRQADGGWLVVDLGSRRGTFHGGERVSTAALADGDELLVGAVRLRFELSATAARPLARMAASADSSDLAELRRENDRLRAIVQLSRALGDAQDLPALLDAVLSTTLGLVSADRASLLLLQPGSSTPSLRRGRTHDGRAFEAEISTSVLSQVLARREAIVTADPLLDERFQRSASLVAQGIRSAMCVPLLSRDELVGVLHLESQLATSVFGREDVALVSAIASQAAAAVKNALLAQRIQSASSEERRRLARLVAHLPDGVILLDKDRRIVLANARAEELLPLVHDARQGRVVEKLGDLDIRDLLDRPPHELVVPAGAKPTVLLISARESSGGEAGEVVVILRDVTEQREHDARSAQQDRLALIGQLAGGVAHDFNNLLAVIINYATFIGDAAEAPQLRDDVGQILDAARRAAELVRQLLAFGRREAVRPRIINLPPLLENLSRLLSRTMNEQVAVRTMSVPGLWRVKIDPTKLEQVLLNLAINARDAMPTGGELTIRAGNVELDARAARLEDVPAGRYLEIEVMDTGTGMPPAIAAHVFEPFFTTKGVGKGTGLGLSTAYGILRQAGGNISVRSQVGLGSTFRLVLPATDAAADSELLVPEGAAGGKETVLVAEDERAVRDSVGRMLRGAGYRVLEAGSGEQALQLAAEQPGEIDLLLTDLVMPGMGGKELAERILLTRPGSRVVYMSGYSQAWPESAQQAPFLAKPFARETMLQCLRAALDAV